MNDILQVLMVIIFAGGFGGFVFGLHSNNSYKVRLPINGKSLEAGFLGDILVGMAASVTIFFVADALFGLQMSKTPTTECLIKIIALGVLSGFAGIKVLSSMSSKLMERISEIDQRVDQVEKTDQVAELLRQADFLLNNNPDSALIIYNKALLIDPNSEPGKIGKAKALRRHGNIEEAVSTLTDVIEINPRAERAYYNRACYKHLSSSHTKEDTLRDLQKAVHLFNFYQAYALEDKDFEDMWGDSDFRSAINNSMHNN